MVKFSAAKTALIYKLGIDKAIGAISGINKGLGLDRWPAAGYKHSIKAEQYIGAN